MRIGVYTDDAFLLRKISLVLSGEFEVESASDTTDIGSFDIVIFDCREKSRIDTMAIPGALCILPQGRAMDGDISYPFSHDTLKAFVKATGAKPTARLILEPNREHVRLDGERIRLTEVESKLLSAILDGNGEYVTREELLNQVWSGTATAGVLNVYIHYLREKLEKRGEKVIISSRKCGYKIDTKYTGGASKC